MPIEKQIWTGIILENPIADDSFLLDSVDMSEFVDNNTIHLADAGVEPEVFVDNDTYPVGIVSREDVPVELPLHTLDTKNTVVRNIEAIEASYNKLESVTMGHKRALARKSAALAAHNWSPLTDSEFTPVIVTTGAADATGRKRLTFDDLDTLEARFRDLEVDLSKLVLVLNSKHLADLKAEDRKLYRECMKDGKIGNFKVRTYPNLPYFDTTSGQKQAFGSAAGANSSMASLAYVSTEVMRARGTTEPFIREKDPEARGDVLGYQQRFTALPLRNKYIGAIYSGK
jgi:hypothetical protein